MAKMESSKRVTHNKGNPFIHLLDNFDYILCRTGMILGSVLVLVTILIVVYSVFMRYVINIPQTWTDELVGYFLVATVMFGVAETLRKNDHIAVDLISAKLSSKNRPVRCLSLQSRKFTYHTQPKIQNKWYLVKWPFSLRRL